MSWWIFNEMIILAYLIFDHLSLVNTLSQRQSSSKLKELKFPRKKEVEEDHDQAA